MPQDVKTHGDVLSPNARLEPAPAIAAEDNSFRILATELIAGAAAGFAEHFIMFPFDTIKTLIQSGRATGVAHAIRNVGAGNTLMHLYRGCAPVLVAAVPAHGAYFGTYEASKRVFGDNALSIGLSASLATVAHDTVSTPFDVVKQRMQMDGVRRYKTSFACCQHIVRTEGVNALFLSLPTTILMNIPHFATYWLVYEGMMRYAHGGAARMYEDECTIEYLGAGFVAGGLASVVSFPFDMVKTHLQLGYGPTPRHILEHIIAKEGIRGMFAGVLPRVLYTAPSGGIMMVTYENMKHLLAR